MLIIQSCVWLSENIVGLLKGLRFPWYSDVQSYVVLGFLGGIVGIWLALQLAPRLNLSAEPYRYFLRAVSLLAVFILVLSLTTVKMAFYPATALFFLSIAMLVRPAWMKLVFWLVSAHGMYHLMFSEGFGLFARSLAAVPSSPLGSVLLHALLILFFSIWSFPFLAGFAAIRFQTGRDLLWVSSFRRPVGIVLAGMVFLATIIILTFQPSYTSRWKQLITVGQEVDLDSAHVRIALRSSESLAGTRVQLGNLDTTITERTTHAFIARKPFEGAPWLTTRRAVSIGPVSEGIVFDASLRVATPMRPYTLSATYHAEGGRIRDVGTPLVTHSTDSSVGVGWYSFPDTEVYIPIRFWVEGSEPARRTLTSRGSLAGGSVEERVVATFTQPFFALHVQKEHASILYRTTVTRRERFSR
jgi:hypothetical protein